jgi:hypothetical protein
MKNVKDIISSLAGDGALVGFVESIVGDKDVAKILVFIVLLVAIVSIIFRFI